MAQDIEFSKIKFGSRFDASFEEFDKNNKINFNNKKVAIVYAPNGPGKSSLAKLLDPLEKKENAEFSIKIGNKTITQDSQDNENPFYVISDFYARNIKDRSHESTQDFILGRDIKRELELEKIAEDKIKDINDKRTNIIKGEFNITAKKDRTRDENGNRERILDYKQQPLLAGDIKLISEEDIEEVNFPSHEDRAKYDFIKRTYNDSKSIVGEFLNIKWEDIELSQISAEIEKIGIDQDAKGLLDKYDVDICPFDDSDTPHSIQDEIKDKLENNLRINKDKLPEQMQEKIDVFLNSSNSEDPFGIYPKLKQALGTGNKSMITDLINDIKKFSGYIMQDILFQLKKTIESSGICAEIKELAKMRNNKLNLGEDETLLQEMMSSMLGCEVKIDRENGESNHIILKIVRGNKDTNLVGGEHSKLPFSTGEQNFISLYLELLLAKNSGKDIIVLDDPISSFDSIYKNKIIYSVLSMLNDSNKNIILLTHNLDAVRLMQHQHKGCYALHLFNNIQGGENGFTLLTDIETENIISISKTLDTIRDSDFVNNKVRDKKAFALSLVPLIRDYVNIKYEKNGIDEDGKSRADNYRELSSTMHGYNSLSINLSGIIKGILGIEIKDNGSDIIICGSGMAEVDIPDEIVDKSSYPLFNKTLSQNLTFLKLRTLVEKTLFESDESRLNINKYPTLHTVIDEYLPRNSAKNRSLRAQLLSKKTLLNEFNHFEGNMSVFLPSLDISSESLEVETAGIDKIIKDFQNGLQKKDN